jgi:hypothetical protein
MIYGHIIAGSVEARVAYIFPADSVLTELAAMLEGQRDPHSPSKIMKIWPSVEAGLTLQVPDLESRDNPSVCPCGVIDERLPSHILLPSSSPPTYAALQHRELRWMSLVLPGNPCHPLHPDSARQFVLVTHQRGTPSLTRVTRIFVPASWLLHKLSAGPISSKPATTSQVASLHDSVHPRRHLTFSNFHMANLFAVLQVDNSSAARLVFGRAADDYGRETMRRWEIFSSTATPAVWRLLVGNLNDHRCRKR